ncbi:MAG TPA: sortase [Patescibacteria group bacterium]
MSYLYVKKHAVKYAAPSALRPRNRKIAAALIFSVGIVLFSSAILPIIQFQLEYSIKFNQIVSPLSARFYNQNDHVLGALTTDYTQLGNWFVEDDKQKEKELSSALSHTPQTSYLLSIPTLKIKDAVVDVGSMDLKKSLIQYPQTALPGQLGNTVIFGHSVLPQFFSPKSYLTIFATLYRLKQGDEILVDYDNVHYRYLVEEMYEIQPTDLSVLEQRYDGRYLTVITCSPPGTVLRRLVVKARIVDL